MKRREFLKTSVAATALSLGTYVPAKAQGANDKINVALVGCGGRGWGTSISCVKNHPGLELRYVCDCNRHKLANCVKGVEETLGYTPKAYEDMRDIFDDKNADVAWIATPEHWHMLAAIRALQAGKNVYVEKNPSINIFEGRQLIKAADKYKKVVQIGFQNRSAPYAFSAREYIKSGKLGKIVTVKSYCLLGGGAFKEAPETPVPEWLDWDKWLGPAPMRPFSPSIVDKNGRGGWLSYWEYGGGTLSDDASHTMDLARMVIGDPDHPKSVCTIGGNKPWGGKSETPEFEEILYDFGDFTFTCSSGSATPYMTKTPGDIRTDKTKFPTWRNNASKTEIYGTKGLMYLGRHGGGWQVLGKDNKIVEEFGGSFPDKEHQDNFVDALRGKAKPNGDAAECHKSACLVHLGHFSYRSGNVQLQFDAGSEKFTNNDKANELARGKYRKGYEVPEEV